MPNTKNPLILEQKVQFKTALQAQLGWPKEPRRPMLCIPTGLSEALGGKLFEEMLAGILSLPVEILVLGKGSAAYGELCTKLSKEHRHRFHIVSEKEDAMDAMYGAADMALFLSDPPQTDVKKCLENGVVPVSPEGGLLEDYNPVQETGNAFLFESLSPWHAFAALVRAVETHKFPFDWKTIQRHCQEGVRE